MVTFTKKEWLIKKNILAKSSAILSLFIIISCFMTGCISNNTTNDSSPAIETTADKENSTMINHEVNIFGEPQGNVYLNSLELSDGYEISLTKEESDYTVKIPSGRPVVPQIISATGEEGANVTIKQSVLPDEEDGVATVTVTKGKESRIYKITFVRDNTLGFELQYDDYWQFTPDWGKTILDRITYSSSNPGVIEVNARTGECHVVGVSQEPVVITASTKNEPDKQMTVTKCNKAKINIFLITGQSNGEGINGNAVESVKPAKGTAYSIWRGQTKIIDLYGGIAGFGGALAQRWYALTGEKCIMVHTAWGGTSVRQWQEGQQCYKAMQDTMDIVEAYYAENSQYYTVYRRVYFWYQGEADEQSYMGTKTYQKQFLKYHEAVKEEYKMELGGIMVVRTMANDVKDETNKELGYNTDLTTVRIAQYNLHNQYNDIYILTRKTEEATVANNMMSHDNLHHSQNGYNIIGEDAANNLFGIYNPVADRRQQEILVLKPDGRTYYTEAELSGLNNEKDIAWIAMPLYTDEKVKDIFTS